VLLSPDQRSDNQRADASLQVSKDNLQIAKDRETRLSKEAKSPDKGNVDTVRAYEQFLSVWDRAYPKPSAGAIDADGNPLPTPPAPPTLDKWAVMTPAERQAVIKNPQSRIDDAEMTTRMGGAVKPVQTPSASSGKVPAAIAAFLKGKTPNKRYTLTDGSVWDVLPDGTIRPGPP
jgi:hypothetical protein